MKLITSFLLLLIYSSNSYAIEAVDGFFYNHSLLCLLGWAFFPRFMFWFFSMMTGGLFFWLGVLFIPRVMVAYWATTYYWDTNPLLCIVAWCIAFYGEKEEKCFTVKRETKES